MNRAPKFVLLASIAAVLSGAGCGSGSGLVTVSVKAEPAIDGVVRLAGEAVSGGRIGAIEVARAGVSITPAGGVKFGVEVPLSVGDMLDVTLTAFDAQGRTLGTGRAQ